MGCWTWTGNVQANGYARTSWQGSMGYAHRFAYEAFWGPIPPGHDVDHLCRNRACYNPWHLEAVTRQENNRRAVRVAPQTCPQGHPLEGRKQRQRYCLVCNAERSRRYRKAA